MSNLEKHAEYGLQRHEDSEDVLDWLTLEHNAKAFLSKQKEESK